MATLRFASLALGALFSTWVMAASVPSLKEANQEYAQGRYEAALAKTDAYLSAKPDDVRARFLKGMALVKLNRIDDAIGVFTRLTEDHPELPEPYNNLAALLAAQGRYEQARHHLELAILTHPDYATAHENLGDLYAKLAARSYGRALELDTSNAAAQKKATVIEEMLGHRGQAAAAGRSTPKTAPLTTEPLAPMPAPDRPQAQDSEAAGTPPASTQAEVRPQAAAAPLPAPAIAGQPRAQAEPARTEPAHARQQPPAPAPVSAPVATPAAGPEVAAKPLTAAPAAKTDAPPKADAEHHAYRGEPRQAIEAALRAWVESLQSRRGYSHAEMSDLEITVKDNEAEARFVLNYRTDQRWGWIQKSFRLASQGGAWAITQER